MAKYTLDIKRLSQVTNKSQKELAKILGVSEPCISQAKTIPSDRWGLIKNFKEKLGLDITDFIK